MSDIRYNPSTPAFASDVFGYANAKVYTEDEIQHISVFGLPVFMPLTLEQCKYKVDNQTIVVPELIIPCVIVEVYGSKEIVKTAVLGRPGTIKEYIAEGDFSITMKGVLANDSITDLRYPFAKQDRLNQFKKAPKQLSITHALLNNLGIYEIVIEDVKFPSMQGVENLCAFEINAISDSPVELVMKKEAVLRNV